MGKKPVDAYSNFTEKIEINPKALKFKIVDRMRIPKCNNILNLRYDIMIIINIDIVDIIYDIIDIINLSYTENCSREILITNSVLKTNPWT